MTATPGHVAGVVLAAGAATRMGKLKQLLPYRGSTILQRVIDVAEASALDVVILVTGFAASEVEGGIRLGRARVVRNPDYRRGNMSSLESGATADPGAAAYLLLMGDHPGIRREVVDRMVEVWRDQSPWAAVADYRDRISHPFLLSRAALEEAVSIGGPKLLWRLLAEDSGARVVRVAFDEVAPRDVNSADDYAALLEDETRSSDLPPR